MPLVKIRYEVGEPLVQFVPYPREFIEQFDAEIVAQGEDYDELMERHAAWNRVRKDDIASRAPLAQHYMRGLDVDGTPHPEHKRAFKVPPFRQDDLTSSPTPSSPTSTPTSESDT
jgi:hypothetical protein